MFKFITHRPLWLNILTGLLLAFVIFFIFIFSLKWLTHHDEAKTVPSVIGKTFTEAKDILEKAGFDVEIQDSLYVDTLKPMRVIKQVPEDGEVVKINRTVYLTINRAVPPSVEMPSLNGFSYRSAAMQLQNIGIKVDTIYKSSFARDAVLEVLYNGDPLTAGTKLRMGDRVKLVLGSGVGTEKFSVPTLTGLTFCQAKSLIESHGLGIGSIIIPPGTKITDTCNAYIFQQNPVKYDEEKKLQYIHTGQTIDVWLQIDKPAPDSLAVPLQQQ
jgi:eukaryotic-like serine/threonine-protein kinase